MPHKSFVTLCVVTILAFASMARAQTIVLLQDSSVKRLDPKAAGIYKQGVDAYDKIDFDTALNKFDEAMKADPSHVQLRFLVARFAYERGKMRMGEEALRLFAMAQEALTGLNDNKTLKPEDKLRVERDLASLKATVDDPHRDSRRETVGRQLVMEIIKERKDQEKGSLKPLGIKDKTQATTPGMAAGKGGKPGVQGQMAGGAPPVGANKNPNAMSNYYNTGNLRR